MLLQRHDALSDLAFDLSAKSKKKGKEAAIKELAELLVSLSDDHWLPSSKNTTDDSTNTYELVQKTISLFEAGSDRSLVACAYMIETKLYQRSVVVRPEVEALCKELYSLICNVPNEPEVYLAYVLDILFDAADYMDSGAIAAYGDIGLRFGKLIARRPNYKRIGFQQPRTPFTPALAYRRFDVVEKLLQLIRPGAYYMYVQGWLDEALLITLWPSLGEPSNSQLATLLQNAGADLSSYMIHGGASEQIINRIIDYADSPANLGQQPSNIVNMPYVDSAGLWSLNFEDSSKELPRGFDGITALGDAVGGATTAICRILLHCGADPNEIDDLGMTALIEAIRLGHDEAVDLLLAHGADPNHICREATQLDSTQPDMKDKYLSLDVADWRRIRKRDATEYSKKKWSALHVAAELGRTKALRALCEAGADKLALDMDGLSPLDLARQRSHYAAASFLFEWVASENTTRTVPASVPGCDLNRLSKSDLPGPFLASRSTPSDSFIFIKTWTDESLVKPIHSADSCDREPDMHFSSPFDFSRSSDARLRSSALCVGCSMGFETGDFSSVSVSSRSMAVCSLCRLIADCQSDGKNDVISLAYRPHSNAMDTELAMTSSLGSIIAQPVLKVSDNWHAILEQMNSVEDDKDTSSHAALSLVTHWLRACLNGHEQCHRDHASQYFPTRVLDIGDLERGQRPRLLQDAKLREPYIALSHRWGLRGLPVTTVENLASRLEGINDTDLSKTMHDAISIVRRLGYRYLWIDALCIIQDSSDDWLSEASKMSGVFSGAVLTIAAADAEDHTQGIFRNRVAQCTRPFHIPYRKDVPHRDRQDMDFEAYYYVFPRNDLVGAGARSKGTLDTRGWILQEQLLSTRILYYDKGQIYWDCVTQSASESSPITTSLLEDKNPDETWALKLLRRTLAGSLTHDAIRTRISNAWLEIIKNYSARELTKQSDRLIALKGIIEPLKAILNKDHIAGMWRPNLWRQLTWWTDAPADAHAFNNDAPSWSWLSIPRRVYYHNSLIGDHPQEQAATHKFTELRSYSFEIDNIESHQIPGTTDVSGFLNVTAKCFPYHLTAKDLKKPVQKRWNRSPRALNTGRWMLDRQLEVPVSVHCLIVAEDTVAKMLVCMVVVEEGDRWRRVGLCHWEGLEWQIQAFIGKGAEVRRFTLV